MLNKDQADRLADVVMATERAKRLPRKRVVWCMWLWRVLCPGLGRLAPEAGRDLAYDAVAEANSHWMFKALAALIPLVIVVVMDRMRMPLGLGLLACLAVPIVHTGLAWLGIARRLPEALARSVKVGDI